MADDEKDDRDPDEVFGEPTDAQPGDEDVNPFAPEDPFAGGAAPAQPGDEDVNPFEVGLEGDPPEEDDPPEDEKPPVQRRIRRSQPRLPGAKGALEVDSIGDYLEDMDWTQIDEESRTQAQQNYPEPEPEPKSEPEPGVGPEPNPTMEPSPKAPEEKITFSNDPPESLVRQQSSMSGDTGEVQSSEYWMPHAGPGSEEHIRSQASVSLEHGSNGPSSWSPPGQSSVAKDEAVQKASDAIDSATGKIVDILTSLTQSLNSHSQRLEYIESMLEMRGESDER